MKALITLILLFVPFTAFGLEKADMVLVIKSEAKLCLVKNEKIFREYSVVFGAHPNGHKQQEGDERTPEGRYILDFKNENSAFYKSIHISYPNETDALRAKELGVDPGGFIMIHGQKNGYEWLARFTQQFNWTDGCIAVSNSDMDEIWEAVEIGIPIEIKP